MDIDDVDHIAAAAEAVESVADLAQVLRALRRREARRRGGRELTYRQIANRTGWSLAVAGEYLTGIRLASVERFDELVRLLGATPAEQGVLASARERAAAGRDPAPAPRMLPAPVTGFVGRARHLVALDASLAGGGVVAVAGMAGVGKTALAVHWAHRVADRFPDGQLHVDLHGYDPGEPLTVVKALGVLLAGLGVAPAAMPVDVAGRVASYGRLLARRRVLVLLDNASGVEQVRPLLPPPPCLAVVTSRDDLAGLDGARRVSLDVLPEGDAVALFGRLVGERAGREPDAVRALARHCGFLPLALRVAAEHAAFRPSVALAELADELRAVGLEALGNAGDERADVATVFSWSLRRLPGAATRAFRMLGLVPGADVDRYGLAALVGVALAESGRLADVLVRAHLVQPCGEGRLSMHDLVRAYAIASAGRALDPAVRHAATTRLLDYYLAAATAAVDAMFPLNRSTRPPGSRPESGPTPMPPVGNVGAAVSWLAAERDNLVRACIHAARHGRPRHAVALALVLRPVLDDGHVQDGLAVQTEALAAARLLGEECDPADLASLHGCLGITNWWLGNLDAAADLLRHALAENIRLGNAGGATLNVAVLGLVHEAEGRYAVALDCQRRGLEMARAAGIRGLVGAQLINVGYIHLRLEEYDVAAAFYQEAHDLFDEGDELSAMALARYCLATAYVGLGRYGEALALAEEALAINRSFGRLADLIRAMDVVASIHRRTGRIADAIDQLTEALRMCRDGHRAKLTAQVLNTLGETYRDAGDHERAAAHHTEALEHAERARDRFEAARAQTGLGEAHAGLGDDELAHRHWRTALAAYTDMNLPAASRIRSKLSMSRTP